MFEDVKVDSLAAPSAIQVLLKVSKTDPFRQGVMIHIGRTGDHSYPVTAVLTYMME